MSGKAPELVAFHMVQLKPMRLTFRLQFLGPSTDRDAVVLEEKDIHATELSSALEEAANAPWPPRAHAYRLLDLDGREIEWRPKAAKL